MWKYILISCLFTYSLSLHFIFTCFINKQILYHFLFILYHFHFISSSLVSLTNKYYITSSLYSINFTSFALLPKWTFIKRSLRFTPNLYQSILLMILNNNGFWIILWKSLYIITSLLFLSFFYYWLMDILAIIWHSLFDNSNHDFHFLSYWNCMRWIGIL